MTDKQYPKFPKVQDQKTGDFPFKEHVSIPWLILYGKKNG